MWVNRFSFFLFPADGAWQLQSCKDGMSVCFPGPFPASPWCQWYHGGSQSQPLHHSPSVQQKVLLVLPSRCMTLSGGLRALPALFPWDLSPRPSLLTWTLCVFSALAVSSLTRWVPTLNTFARGLVLPLDCSAQKCWQVNALRSSPQPMGQPWGVGEQNFPPQNVSLWH